MTKSVRKISQFSKPEIDYAFKHAVRLIKAHSIVILCAPAQHAHGRILVIASRKTGKAVVRNKLKRRLKSVFYEEKMFELRYDFIIIAKPGIIDLDFKTVQQLLIDAKNQCLKLSATV